MIFFQAPEGTLPKVEVSALYNKTPSKDVAQNIANWHLKANEDFKVKLVNHMVGAGRLRVEALRDIVGGDQTQGIPQHFHGFFEVYSSAVLHDEGDFSVFLLTWLWKTRG